MSGTGTEFTARDDPSLGSGARVYRLACTHGVSSALLLQGRRPVSDRVVLDMLLTGHHRSRLCQCVPLPPTIHQGEAAAYR